MYERSGHKVHGYYPICRKDTRPDPWGESTNKDTLLRRPHRMLPEWLLETVDGKERVRTKYIVPLYF